MRVSVAVDEGACVPSMRCITDKAGSHFRVKCFHMEVIKVTWGDRRCNRISDSISEIVAGATKAGGYIVVVFHIIKEILKWLSIALAWMTLEDDMVGTPSRMGKGYNKMQRLIQQDAATDSH